MRAGKMRLPGRSRPHRLRSWIDVKNKARHFAPIRAIGLCIEQSKIGDYVLAVIGGDDGIFWRMIGNIRVERCP